MKVGRDLDDAVEQTCHLLRCFRTSKGRAGMWDDPAAWGKTCQVEYSLDNARKKDTGEEKRGTYVNAWSPYNVVMLGSIEFGAVPAFV